MKFPRRQRGWLKAFKWRDKKSGPRANHRKHGGPRVGARGALGKRRRGFVTITRTLSVAFSVLVMLVGGWISLVMVKEAGPLLTRWFTVRQITVEGLHHVGRAEIVELLGLGSNQTLWSVRPAVLAMRVEHHPWVKHAEVTRIPPDRVKVEVIERKPAAVVKTQADHFLADDEGHVLDTIGGMDEPKLPLLTGLEATLLLDGDERTQQAVVSAIELARLIGRTLGGRAEINAADPRSLSASVKGVRFQFGASDVDEQWDRFRRIKPSVRAVSGDDGGARGNDIDLRYPGRVIVRERG
jgi:cell division protein FtsQ